VSVLVLVLVFELVVREFDGVRTACEVAFERLDLSLFFSLCLCSRLPLLREELKIPKAAASGVPMSWTAGINIVNASMKIKVLTVF